MGRTYGLLIFILVVCHAATAQVKFVIEALPETTPANDTIFISGTFNDWVTNDPKYMLTKQPNGKLAITLSFDKSAVEYKFTRGDWLKVETGRKNSYIPNRVIQSSTAPKVISIRIQNWQDLGGARRFEYLTFYFFTTAIVALFLVFLSMRIFKKEPGRMRAFIITHFVLFIAFLGAVVYYVVNPIWQTYVISIGQVMVFAWGPVFYLFLMKVGLGLNTKFYRWYAMPGFVALIFVMMRWLNPESMSTIFNFIYGYPAQVNLVILGCGVFVFGIFLFKLLLENGSGLLKLAWIQRGYIVAFIIINLLCAILLLKGIVQEYMGVESMAFNGYKLFLVSLSLVAFLEGLVIWKDPHFFKTRPQNIPLDDAGELLEKLELLMEQEEAFRHPELSVNKLADMLETKPHVLSKLLNEHYGQNFRDFINGFRVEQFIRQASEGKLENLTFLGLAHEVGFNSKSTFNLAFKKFTGRNPRDYFKSYAT